ncbi:hypothetical protein B0T21DRAFT_411865 [Apiosordaria backusii]|uniref:Uncharacterized protein n=1 Tax=Apiosordaria backusii TaxID=314023 RepID=A0AA40BM21_9PEZI|nr:hypothetical protein B0T21DRAFT_411865 [Apiosordaria backusii]
MASNARNPTSNARRGGRSGWGRPKVSGSGRNRRDDEEDDHQQPNKEQTWVSLLSDDEDEEDVSPSQKRDVSHVDAPNDSPAAKRMASVLASGNNRSPFRAAGPAFSSTALVLHQGSPSSTQVPATVNQLAAQLHQKQDENAQLVEKIDDLRLISAEKDQEIASLRAIIDGMQKAAADDYASVTGRPAQQLVSEHQLTGAALISPCNTCAETNELKQKLADVQLALSKSRNTVVGQHDEIKALMEEANANKTALIQERAMVAQHKLSIDQLGLKLAAEQATAKDIPGTLAENQVVIEHLKQQLSVRDQELSDARESSMFRGETNDVLESQVTKHQEELVRANNDRLIIKNMGQTIEDLKKQLANGQAELHNARTTIFVNGAVIQDLKEQAASSQGAGSGNPAHDKDKQPDDDKEALKSATSQCEELNVKLREAETEIENLTLRLKKVEHDYYELRQTYLKDEKDKEGLRNDLLSAWDKHDEMNAETVNLRRKVESQQAKIVEYEKKLEQQQEEVILRETMLEQQRQSFEEEKKVMHTSIKSLQERLTQSETDPEMEALRKTVQDLNGQVGCLQSERDLAVQEMTKHKANEHRQAAQLQAIKSALEMSQSHVQSLMNQLEKSSQHIKALEAHCQQIEAQLIAAENMAKEAEAKTAQVTNQFENYKEESAYLKQQEINQHSQNINQLNATIFNSQQHIQALEARIADLQNRHDASTRGSINQPAIQAQIAHLQSQLMQKNDEIAAANAQLDRVFSQYQELSDERAEDKRKIAALVQQNQVLGSHIEALVTERNQAAQELADVKVALVRAETEVQQNQVVGTPSGDLQTTVKERDQALQELEDTKVELGKAKADIQFLIEQSIALEEGTDDPRFAHMESSGQRVKELEAELGAVSREKDKALQKLKALAAQLGNVSRERDETFQQLEVSRAALAGFQTRVEDLQNQLSEAETHQDLDPAAREALVKARAVQSARDISDDRVNGSFSMKPNTDDADDDLPMPLRAERLPESSFKTLKKENLQNIIRHLEDEHEGFDDTVRTLTTRIKGQRIKVLAWEKEAKVWKAIARAKDKFIDQVLARLFGNSHGTVGRGNPEDETMMDIKDESDFYQSGGENEPETRNVDMKDPTLSQKTLVVTFGPTRRGYKGWKEADDHDFDRYDPNTSMGLRVAMLTEQGKKIYSSLRKYGKLPAAVKCARVPATPTSTTATQLEEILVVDDETYSRYTASQETSPPTGPLGPALRSASASRAGQADYALAPPVEFGVARRGGAAAQTSSPHDPSSTQGSSQTSTNAVYPAPSWPSRSARGKYTSHRFRPSATPTRAGPSRPPRPHVPTSTPPIWHADDVDQEPGVDMDTLGAGFTMESIEQDPELPRGSKEKGKEKAGPRSQEEYEG